MKRKDKYVPVSTGAGTATARAQTCVWTRDILGTHWAGCGPFRVLDSFAWWRYCPSCGKPVEWQGGQV